MVEQGQVASSGQGGCGSPPPIKPGRQRRLCAGIPTRPSRWAGPSADECACPRLQRGPSAGGCAPPSRLTSGRASRPRSAGGSVPTRRGSGSGRRQPAGSHPGRAPQRSARMGAGAPAAWPALMAEREPMSRRVGTRGRPTPEMRNPRTSSAVTPGNSLPGWSRNCGLTGHLDANLSARFSAWPRSRPGAPRPARAAPGPARRPGSSS
jgi:hypothetical protein